MKTLSIAHLTLSSHPGYLEVIEHTIRELGFSASFLPVSDDLFGQDETNIDIIILEPRIVRWEWLDVLIQSRRFYSNIPVILFSHDLVPQNMFTTLSGDSSVFILNGVDMLKENFNKVLSVLEMSRKKILFVDDDVHILRSYERALRKTPWKILTIPSARKALEIIQKEKIDMVVTDIKMPGMHGFELISRIRKQTKALPIIICSGYQGMREDADIILHNVAEFFEKPVDLETLKMTIKTVFGKHVNKPIGRNNNIQLGA